MCFTFKKNNKQTKKPVNCFSQDDASAGIQSLQTSIEIKLCQNPWNGLLLLAIVIRSLNSELTVASKVFLLMSLCIFRTAVA